MITLFINKLESLLSGYKPIKRLISDYIAGKSPIEIEGPEGFFTGYLASVLMKYSKHSFLLVTATEKEASLLVSDIEKLVHSAQYFPCWENIPYSGNNYQTSLAGRRIRILSGMLQGKKEIIVSSLRALLTPVSPPRFIQEKLFTIKAGEPLDPVQVSEKLVALRYMRVSRVTMPGEFALRGEVLDIFLPGMEDAVRIVFEWDEVEAIRLFDPVNQNSIEELPFITVYPSSEILWDEERITVLKEVLKDPDETIDALRTFGNCKNEEIFFSASFDKQFSLLDYLDEGTTVFLIGDDRLRHAEDVLKKEYSELYKKARSSRIPVIPPSLMLKDFDSLQLEKMKCIIFPTLRDETKERIRIPFTGPRSFFSNLTYMKEELQKLIDLGYEIFIFADSAVQSERISYLLKDFSVSVIPESISSGFSLPDVKFTVIEENEIFGRRRRIPPSVRKVQSKAVDTFVELNQGDYIVHVHYGIGKFKGIERIKAAGSERDYIELEYAGEETIFIPIEQVNLIQRYIGQEGHHPALDRIGGKSWEKRKNRVKKSVEDLAEMLVSLYAKRKNARGFAFPPDTDWQLEFEAGFPYEETEDQLQCSEEVKMDMESSKPMDRLICGDVGYGKTEVAMRAAFKAVVSGKQVAFLAPTTILAEQHYDNFVERFKNFPVSIELISRFVSVKKQKEILRKLSEGQVDLLIGTHRIVQKDVVFKNLGLLIIDEEQRFGVKDKEKLKELKFSVDCLSLSATPIPRTLHMSLLKIRDMSLLTTAPYSRRPIETIIQEFDEDIVARAIRKEVSRGGQVFYLHNRVETLEQTRMFLEKLVPELLIETAHGKMTGTQLEDVMYRFIHGGFHVLVATTIIENGIDIPNVNTILIDRADMYGISQLYQLRGRVGRSDRKAFAYLLFPDKRALSEIAMKRLSIISDFTDLGSGFKIAMKDLEVRGAGNLLGRQQHGEILSVGFDMYLKILDDAISELSPEKEESAPEVYLDLDYSGYIPDSYIHDPVEKMEIYKKIASIQTEFDLELVSGELLDRFGPLPDEVSSLVSISELRIICRKLFVQSLIEKKGTVRIIFSKVSILSVDRVLRLLNESNGSVRLDPSNPNVLIIESGMIGLKDKSEFIREKLQFLL